MISILSTKNKIKTKLDKRQNKCSIKKKSITNSDEMSSSTTLIVTFNFGSIEKWSLEDLRQFLLQSMIRLFGVIRVSPINLTITYNNDKISNYYKIIINSKYKDIVYTGLCLIDERVKPIILEISN
jgi:hypothetical protein